MDILIKWEDGTENVVAIKELSLINGLNRFEKNKKVKMDYGEKLYYGIIVATENNDDSDAQYNSSDDNSQEEVGLSKSPLSECGSDDNISSIVKNNKNKGINKCSALRCKAVVCNNHDLCRRHLFSLENWTNKELEKKSGKINKRNPKANEAANLGNEDSNEKLCEHPNCSFEIYSA
ncbi:unnamed protein product [Psylliodes chrysocephalus]|uniref:Uncharacterized protein n=1 Tax=Psylliodes chrysocephalus TaxID=3402493 RepID=A0A9P0CH76_9CUCU|nr:unnamed protein product [Psylliodes chrysocephala]